MNDLKVLWNEVPDWFGPRGMDVLFVAFVPSW